MPSKLIIKLLARMSLSVGMNILNLKHHLKDLENSNLRLTKMALLLLETLRVGTSLKYEPATLQNILVLSYVLGLNDGAAAVVLMSSENASLRSIHPLAKIVAYAAAGVNPEVMGTGPIPAVQKAVRGFFISSVRAI